MPQRTTKKKPPPFTAAGARRAALLIAHVTEYGDLNRLRDAIDARRMVLHELTEAKEAASAWELLEAAGPGSTWTKSKSVIGGVIPPGVVLVLKKLHRGRKHVGGWFTTTTKPDRSFWMRQRDFCNLERFEPSADTAEEQRERAAHRQREQGFADLLSTIAPLPRGDARGT